MWEVLIWNTRDYKFLIKKIFCPNTFVKIEIVDLFHKNRTKKIKIVYQQESMRDIFITQNKSIIKKTISK